MAIPHNTSAITHSSLMSGATPYPIVSNGGAAPAHAIQGKMLKCESLITQEDFENWPKSEIKRKMMTHMVEELLKADCIEFTMTKAPNTDYLINMVQVRARVFVTPNDQVKLLRENGY